MGWPQPAQVTRPVPRRRVASGSALAWLIAVRCDASARMALALSHSSRSMIFGNAISTAPSPVFAGNFFSGRPCTSVGVSHPSRVPEPV